MAFQCSICGETSTRICARCTKDACDNHLCEKCLECSDCCECEVSLSSHAPETVRSVMNADANHRPPVVAPEMPAPEEVIAETPEPGGWIAGLMVPAEPAAEAAEPAVEEQPAPEFMVPAEPQLETRSEPEPPEVES